MARLAFLIVICAAFTCYATGCGSKLNESSSADKASSDASVENVQEESQTKPTLELDEEPLDVENPESPEGVVNAFFKAFFSGDDDAAFELLSPTAQEAQREQFATQASNSIRWRIIQKTKANGGRALAWVEVEDYGENGDLQMDTLTFVLTNSAGAWRIAAFTVGDIAVNFEENVMDVVAQEERAATENFTRVAEQTDGKKYR
ncbi:MAG: hypothetical protein Q4G03_02455 [Planctomycetia bacterium]|nr:hypothetical protein [Planctomycetia bacterium]